MHLKRMRLQHFGAFRDTGWLTFSRGVNLIVGQNNSGKSSLIKSFEAALRGAPHVSLEAYRTEDLQQPLQELELGVTGREVRRALLQRGGSIYWPLDAAPNDVSPEAIERGILGDQNYVMKFERTPGETRRVEGVPTHSIFEGTPNFTIQLVARAPIVVSGGYGGGDNDSIVDLIPTIWNHAFVFDAERTGVGQCAQYEAPRLTPKAENLPAYLHLMRGRRPAVFDRLVEHVRTILPTVYSITTTSVGGADTRILVWPTPHMDREEYSFPLADSGTGVGQVLAILAAAMSNDPTVLVIDEVNTFLHPSAVKALLRLLQNSYGHHQYIISTHSPEVISNGAVSSVYLVKRAGMESSVQLVDMTDIGQLREMSDHIGISVSDVFSADQVLWVEGRTEELCFSLLKDKLGIPFPPNTIISPVVATGDFFSHKRDIGLVFQIYERLARVTLPLVRSVAFSFDREDLTPNEMTDTNRRAGGRVAFLPRRHLECYLVIPHAITRFINESDWTRGGEHSVEIVESLLIAKAAEQKYLARDQWNGRLTDEAWLESVDAAGLIKDVILELTEHRVVFNKVEDSAKLLELILEHDSAPVSNLIAYVIALSKLLEVAH